MSVVCGGHQLTENWSFLSSLNFQRSTWLILLCNQTYAWIVSAALLIEIDKIAFVVNVDSAPSIFSNIVGTLLIEFDLIEFEADRCSTLHIRALDGILASLRSSSQPTSWTALSCLKIKLHFFNKILLYIKCCPTNYKSNKKLLVYIYRTFCWI